MTSHKKFFKHDKPNNLFSFAFLCEKHSAEENNGNKFNIPEIIEQSKKFQKENIEALEKKNKKMAEDWLAPDLFDFGNDDGSFGFEKKENYKKNRDFFNEYPIKKRKLEKGDELNVSVLHEKQININDKRTKKIKKQYSPTDSPSFEKKKKIENNHLENYSKHGKKGKKEKIKEKYEPFLKKIKMNDELKKSTEKKGEYPNFLDDNREM